MSEHTYHTFRQELLALYKAKAYSQALALVEKEHVRFPEDACDSASWRLCLYTILNKQEDALRLLRDSLSRGEWFPPDWLAYEPDLVSLHAFPAFQEAIEVCRHRLAQSKACPALLVRSPAEQTRALPLLIAISPQPPREPDSRC